jgi:bilin biosynthesis protein
VFCAIVHPLEPRYGGKRLSEWADILAMPWDEYRDEQKAREAESHHGEAENAIRHIGTRAFPYAIKWCRATDSAWKEKTQDWLPDWLGRKQLFGVELNELYQIHFHFISANDLHQRSGEIFRILALDAKPEIPVLIKLLENKDQGVAGAAADDLCNIGPDAVAPLTAALTNSNAQVRRYAASLLGDFPPAATSAVPALALCLSDQDFQVRGAAAFTLGQIGTNSPTLVVPALVDALKKETNSESFCARSLIRALGRFGTNAETAVPVLKNILESQQPTPLSDQPGFAAMFALNKIDPETAKPYMTKWKASVSNFWASANRLGPARAASLSAQTNSPSRNVR